VGRKFGESRVICQTKIIQTLYYVTIIINSQRHLPNFPLPSLLRTEFAKLSCYMIRIFIFENTFVKQFANGRHMFKTSVSLLLYMNLHIAQGIGCV